MNTFGMKEINTYTHTYMYRQKNMQNPSSSKIFKENLEVIIRVISYSLWVKAQLTEHSGN